MFEREIRLPKPGRETFFLWGPRQVGKSTLLKRIYPNEFWIDLLKSEEYRKYLQNPEHLREQLLEVKGIKQVVIDEIQKVPQLLDEVHWLIENRNICFALCGSSARKVKRGQANLLGGRAIRYQLFGLTASELGKEFDIDRMINHGYMPTFYQSKQPKRLLNSYVSDYLKEEIAAEGLVRKLPVFSEFLNVASLSDTELINHSTIARECGVSSHSIKGYFQILEDTLLGSWLPAYTRRPKRRVIQMPKFYFADVALVNLLAKRQWLEPGSALYGKAFENWVHHELRAYISYSETLADLRYWRLASGIEVDFIIGDMDVAIEAKATGKVRSDHLKGLRHLTLDHPDVRQRIVVCLESKARRTEDGIRILPAIRFIKELENGELF